MLNNTIRILSTRPLSNALLATAAQKNIIIEAYSFIETVPTIGETEVAFILQKSLEKAAVIFTSMNAVEAVIDALQNVKPDWNIYSMGGTTKTLVAIYFGANSIKGTAKDAQSLAQSIINNHEQRVIFFCGNIRRDELPTLLNANQIQIEELVVYDTIATPKSITKHYDAIIFYSPSAVESLFSNNTLSKETVLFAIGKTTAKTIAHYTTNTIVISDSPEKEQLARKAVDYFEKEMQVSIK